MEIVAFAFRLALASVFTFSAIPKLLDLREFVASVDKYHVLPQALARAYALFLPPAELMAGIALLAGLSTNAASLALLAIVGTFFAAGMKVVVRGEHVDCGCFGLLYRERVGPPTLMRDLALMGMVMVVFRWDTAETALYRLVSDGWSADNIVIAIITLIVFAAIAVGAYLASRPVLAHRRLARSLLHQHRHTLEKVPADSR